MFFDWIFNLGFKLLELLLGLLCRLIVSLLLPSFSALYINLHLRWDLIRKVKFKLVFQLQRFDLFLKIVQEVEALGERDVSVKRMGQAQAYLFQIEVAQGTRYLLRVKTVAQAIVPQDVAFSAVQQRTQFALSRDLFKFRDKRVFELSDFLHWAACLFANRLLLLFCVFFIIIILLLS